MRICIVRATGKLIEAQSLATPGTLLSNAIKAGYTADQVEEKVVTDVDFVSILRTPEVIAAEEERAQRLADIADALPSWQQVSDAIDGVTTIAGLKAVVKKLARVVYWLAKNRVN